MRVAVAVFSRKGFENTSVEEICLAAGYSKGGFYFHFRGKNDLLVQILKRDVDVIGAEWLDALTAELWAGAARNEAVRERLAERQESRRRDLIDDALACGQDPTTAPRMLELLLVLDAGLRVQQRFSARPADEALRFVEAMVATLTVPATELPEYGRRAAS